MIEYVVARNKNREQIGIIDLFSSVIWSRQYYGTGEFEIYCQATPKHIELLREGNFITRNDDDEIGIIEKVSSVYSPYEGKMISAAGRFAKSILDRRVIYKLSGTQNPPTIIKGNVETAVRGLVNSNIISAADAKRNISWIKLGAVAGIDKTIIGETGEAAEKQTTFDGLLEYIEEVLQEYELGSRMTLDAEKNLVYSIYQGIQRQRGNTAGNKLVIFSQEYDNLQSSSYEYDETGLKTTALVGGAGEELERFYTVYGGSKSGIDRREVFVNASGVSRTYKNDKDEDKEYTTAEYTELLKTEARQELEPQTIVQHYTGDIDVTNSVYRYKEHFDLGDVVTVQDKSMGVEIATRLVNITETQDANGYSIHVEFTA